VGRNVVGERHACPKKPPRSRGGVVTTANADHDQADQDADRADTVTELQGEIQALADQCDDVTLLLKIKAMLAGE